MAILFRILFTLGLLILHVSVSSAQTQVNRNGPETPLKFETENPSYVLASPLKNSPTYLNCHISVKIDKTLVQDLKIVKFYHDPAEESEDDDEDPDDDSQKYTEDDIRRLYQHQEQKYMNKTNTIPVLPTPKYVKKRSVRIASEPIRVTVNKNDNDDEDSEENHAIYTEEEIRRMYESNRLRILNKPIKPNAAKPTINNKHVKRQTLKSFRDPLAIDWYRDDEVVISLKYDDNQTINMNGYTLFPNGTLKFQALNLTSQGVYRCNVTYFEITKAFTLGPIISQATVVEVANLINDASEKQNLTILETESTVINCPISSVPEGNFSWFFNNNEISFETGLKQRDIRHFLLTNGSLLIVNSRTSDSGKYRCNVTNQFVKKPLRSSFSLLNVMSRSDNNNNRGSSLLPRLQSFEQKIKSGQSLVLHCASQSSKIQWTFTPRTSSIPISLTDFNNELKYVNVSVAKHDGIYNCSTDSDFQNFDVMVVTPPVFIEPTGPKLTSVSASIKFNCSVSGNPAPVVEWYKNGRKVPNNHVKYFEYPIIKIETIDPEDEGIYQCLARNAYGEVSSNFYLHVRPTQLMDHGPKNPKCYPMDKNKIHVSFSKEDSSNKIQYFIATDSPRDFYSTISIDGMKSFIIDTTKASIFKPLKPFYLYMRNMQPLGGKMLVSQLSKPIICSSQGIEPKFVKPPNGIFLRWETPDTGGMNVTGYTIQFLNKNSNQVTFTSEAIGTYEDFPSYVIWEEVQKSLEKIPVKFSSNANWNEVQVPGNVTGLYIINTHEVDVRILGTVLESGELMDQDHEFLAWSNIKASTVSLEPIRLGEVDSRWAEILWSGLDVECAEVCAILKKDFFIREPSEKFKCDEILTLSAKSFYLRSLKPTSDYDVFIRDCAKNVISTQINFQTKRDVPGAVSKARIIPDNGIILSWEPPIHPNGDIDHYFIKWTVRNATHQENVTELNFKFPNTTSVDRFNITIQAYGVAGLGHPVIINPDRWDILPMNVFGTAEQTNATVYFDSFMIFVIMFISLMLLVLVIGYVFCRRHRYCKNSNGIINSEQSSFPPTTSPLTENIRSDEMYEMQTLIPATQLVIANGKDITTRSENPSNGGIGIVDNQKILRTSTPTDESVDQMCIELPPIKCDESLSIQIDRPKPANGFLETFSSKQPSTTEHKDLKNGSVKVNGNSSPFKCFQSPGNDQNSSSGSSSFDSHRQLIESNLCNGLNNNNVNDRSKIGKSSSIETDNEEEDSEENLHDYDLNDSNLSSKPLHPMSWDFRRPLVGPNG